LHGFPSLLFPVIAGFPLPSPIGSVSLSCSAWLSISPSSSPSACPSSSSSCPQFLILNPRLTKILRTQN
jgi:hypothetical protein